MYATLTTMHIKAQSAPHSWVIAIRQRVLMLKPTTYELPV